VLDLFERRVFLVRNLLDYEFAALAFASEAAYRHRTIGEGN